MVYAAVVVAVVLFLPVFISVYAAFDARCKKLYFAIYAFGKIKAICGYFKPNLKGGYLHVGKKAYYLKYSSMLKMKKSPITLSAFTVTGFESNVFFSETSFAQVYSLTAIYLLAYGLSAVFCERYNSLKIKNNLFISDGGFIKFAFNANVNLVFCVFGIMVNAIKNLIKKGVKSAKKRKQNCRSN